MKSKNVFLRLQWIAILALLIALVYAVVPTSIGKASTVITVTTTSDTLKTDGFCSLREAVIAANTDHASSSQAGECPAGSGADTIIVPAGTYTLTKNNSGTASPSTGDLDVTSDVTIQGAGPGKTIIIGATKWNDRIFNITGGNVTISGVTISSGNDTNNGGALFNSTQLTLVNTVITSSNTTLNGGGIYNAATGNLVLNNSLVTSNTTTINGGGIMNDGGTVAVKNATIYGNSAGSAGGGIENGGSITVNNATIDANTADTDKNGSGDGGGIFQATSGTFTLSNTIISGNIDLSPSTKVLDCAGSINSLGNNLIQNVSGCTLTGTTTSNITGVDPQLGPPQNNGGPTNTQAIPGTSPALDHGSLAAAGTAGACEVTDQRGTARPQGPACDIGAFELVDPLQTGPVYTINATDDLGGGCYSLHCSLREAITSANGHANGSTPDQIVFNIPGTGAQTIKPASALPAISDPVSIDGTTQPGGSIVLDGSGSTGTIDGLAVSGGGTTIKGLTIQKFSGNGINLNTVGSNKVLSNTIATNAGAGILVASGVNNTISANLIFGNGHLGIDLGGDGVTPNAVGARTGANNLQNYPVILSAVPGTSNITISGRINSLPSTAYNLEFFSNPAADPSGFGQGQVFIGNVSVQTDAQGNDFFSQTFNTSVAAGQFITATATDSNGNTSEFSQSLPVGVQNTAWPVALQLNPGSSSVSADQYLDKQGEVRWYKFPIQPGSRVVVTLTKLPANFDLTLYKDIGAAFNTVNSNTDLARLGAEFAPDAFSPDAFSPDAFSPDAFSPDAFSPDAFSPDAFSPDAFSPDAFSPDAFSPDAFSPDAFSPDAFSPDAFSPDAFSPDAFSPDAFSAASYSSAQSRSLIGVSAFDGTASEGIVANTWDNSGYFYIRVRGRNGAFSQASPYHLTVSVTTSQCSTVGTTSLPASSLQGVGGNYKTLILTDISRMSGSSTDISTMQSKLASFAARSDVGGVVVDVEGDQRVAAANQLADANPACPIAKNMVAQSIKAIVDSYVAANPGLQYIQVVGGDNVIPFFRHPDQALLASENNYVPPVKDASPSQASLRLNYFLSQDDYGSQTSISRKIGSFPLPGLAVGRLVETPTEISTMLDAYLSTSNGVVNPSSAMVTGYDFLANGAQAVADNLQAGLGKAPDLLINPRTTAPTDPSSWTASQLSSMLLGSRHDVIFLAGHFSASTALAADFTTRIFASDLANSTVDMKNSIVFSAGCHAGYNVVNADGIPQVTLQPDWAEAFAMKGATLIAGTGYQYGDTDFIEYSERLYLDFSQQLLLGNGPVPVGKALMAAKQSYLASTTDMRGINEKALLEATLFGFPMLSINMPAGRIAPTNNASIVTSTQGFTTNPGLTLGLTSADVTVNPSLTTNTVTQKNPIDNSTVTATYLSGSNGTVSRPDEPVLPLEIRNVSVPNTVLRGVGFRGGSYTDTNNILPLTGAATTEIRGVHSPFLSDIFYPVQPWSINYFAALENSTNGATNLVITPAQYESSSPFSSTGTLRQYNSLNFRLFYSANTTTFTTSGNTPALASAPSIVIVNGDVASGNVNFRVKVTGDPSAGIQQVWVTYTILGSGTWQSVDLTMDSSDSTLWNGSLALNGADPNNVRYIVQAANGVGLVSLATNLGAGYIPGANGTPTTPTQLSLTIPTASGAYGTMAAFSAQLTSNGAPLAGKRVSLGLGPQTRQAMTDNNGIAQFSIPLLGLPGPYSVRAAFAGDGTYIASSASGNFTINKQSTKLVLSPNPSTGQYSDPTSVIATLVDGSGRPVTESTVFFIVSGNSLNYAVPVITDYAGRAPLGLINLPAGAYTISAYYSGTIPLPGGSITLDDSRYTPTSVNGSFTVVPEDSTVAYSGSTLIQVGTPLALSAKVTQANDGYPGNLTLAKVQFSVIDPATGNSVGSILANVDATGNATASLTKIPTGIYQLQTVVTGGYFASPAVNVTLVVYDTSSKSSVTGSAGINSPAGAYVANPSLTGSTSFGLNASYSKGAPGGQTQFQFQVANMNFHSSTYNWLVVNGPRGQYQGTGTINNSGNFGFMVTIYDGSPLTPPQPETFRMKIWDMTSGAIVYDSQMGAPDYAMPNQPLTGGSITVH